MNKWGTWVIFSQLKADVSHSRMRKTILETATLEPQLEYSSSGCWVPPKLCCACPYSWPTAAAEAAAAALRWVLSGCLVPAGLWCWKMQLKQCLSNFLSLTHVSMFVLCAFLRYSGKSLWASLTSQTLLPRTHSGYKKVSWSQSEPIMSE